MVATAMAATKEKEQTAHLVPRQVQNQVSTEFFRRRRIQIQEVDTPHGDAEVLVELPCCERGRKAQRYNLRGQL